MRVVYSFFWIVLIAIFSGCGAGKSYPLVRIDKNIECNCADLKKNIRILGKQYKTKKSIKKYEEALFPVDYVNGKEFLYEPFKIVRDCSKVKFDLSEDSLYYLIKRPQWEALKESNCSK